MQQECSNCMSGNVAPFSGMTDCLPCPAQHNASIWISLVAQKLRTNASDAEVLLAAATVDASCFQIQGISRNDSMMDTIAAISTTVIAIICTIAGIILILAVYFIKKRCMLNLGNEDSRQSGEKIDTDISIAEVPDNIRTNMMVKWGGQYFYQLLQGRQNASESVQGDIELCSVGDPPSETEPIYSGVPRLAELITVQMAEDEDQEDEKEADDDDICQRDEPAEQHSLRQNPDEQENFPSQSASLTSISLAPMEEKIIQECDEKEQQPAHQSEQDCNPEECEIKFLNSVENSSVDTRFFPKHSDNLGDLENPSVQQQQYYGKKYSIDLENVR